jgi:hypothetical protein
MSSWLFQLTAYLADERVQLAARSVFEAEYFEQRGALALADLSRRTAERRFASAEALHEAGATAW